MKKLIIISAAVSAVLGAAQSAHAIDLKAGDWTVSIGGIVNAYYTQISCSGDAVGGLALGSAALGCGGKSNRTTIGNGLLPSGLITSVKSRQGDYDVSAKIGIMTATASDSAIGNNSNVDVRQGYFTFGNAEMGTVKLGRDYGLFGANAILNDMTLIGSGAPVRATQANRVTLGHIGAGYSYLGTYGQIAYSSSVANVMKIDLALISPVSNGPLGAGYDSGSSPQVQGRIGVDQAGLKAWLGAKGQKFTGSSAATPDFTMRGIELGASYTAGAFGVLANVQTGSGLGMLSDGDQGDVKSTNYFAQGTYKLGEQVKLGLNYGMNKNRDNTAATGGLESNSNLTGGVYFAITPSITLSAEIGQTRSKGVNGNTARMNGGSFGGIFFF
ncbi:hypothetical protein BH11PSE12_BH11PSE12_24790 [soil metagenome]